MMGAQCDGIENTLRAVNGAMLSYDLAEDGSWILTVRVIVPPPGRQRLVSFQITESRGWLDALAQAATVINSELSDGPEAPPRPTVVGQPEGV